MGDYGMLPIFAEDIWDPGSIKDFHLFSNSSSEWTDQLAVSLVDELAGLEDRSLSGFSASPSYTSDASIDSDIDDDDDEDTEEADIAAYIKELVYERNSIRYRTTWSHSSAPAASSWHGLPRALVGQRYVSVLSGRW